MDNQPQNPNLPPNNPDPMNTDPDPVQPGEQGYNNYNNGNAGAQQYNYDYNMTQAMPNAPQTAMQGGVFQPTQPLPGATAPADAPQPKKPFLADWTTFQIVVVIVVGLLAVTFIGLFIWMFVMWSNADANAQSQIDSAVAEAVNAKTAELEEDFTEREKYPYKIFTGPIDYGELTFEYPKTWSAYVAKDASGGGDFEAYLNPDYVSPAGGNTINSLRVTIMNQSADQVSRTYENSVKQGKLTVEVHTINGESANLYRGSVTNNIQGIAAVFKIRDKTVVMQTDAMIFEDDFMHVLDSIKYNN